jgi:hypothetical protein
MLIDNTKLSDFKRCPRFFCFRHVIGMRPNTPAQDLAFGIAFHVSLEHMYKTWKERGQGFTPDCIIEGFKLGLEAYRNEGFPPETDSGYKKNPETLLNALVAYADTYGDDDMEVLYTEISGEIPLDELGRKIYFRLDTVCKDARGLFILEHKTTGWRMDLWEASFEHSTQIGTAQHVLESIGEQVLGVFVNGVSFATKEPTFNRIFFKRKPIEMEDWRQTTVRWIQQVETEEALLEASKDKEVTAAFPRNDKGCMAYNRKCPYFDVCRFYQNPLHAELPVDMVIDFWDPRKGDTNE